MNSFSLINFNTLGTPFFAPHVTQRYQKIAEVLNKSQATFLCLQEVTTYYHLFLLKKYLTEYPYLYYKKFIYGPKGGLVIFSKKQLDNVSYKEFNKLGKLTNITFYAKLLRNGILSAYDKDLNINIITTHLICDFNQDESEDNKLYKTLTTQVYEIIDYINHIRNKKISLLLCGDFNMHKKTLLYKQLLEKTKLIDAFKDIDMPTYDPNRIPFSFPTNEKTQIDHCFYTPGSNKLTVEKHSFLFEKKTILKNGKKTHLSDHLGLQISFKQTH